MSKIKRAIAVLVATAVVLCGSVGAYGFVRVTIISYPDYAVAAFTLVNDLRGELRLNALTFDPDLMKAADLRARELATSFSHTRPDGSAYSTAIENRSDFSNRAENIAYGPGGTLSTPQKVFEMWSGSAGHYENMTSSDFTLIGVGRYSVGDTDYWVLMFGDKRG